MNKIIYMVTNPNRTRNDYGVEMIQKNILYFGSDIWHDMRATEDGWLEIIKTMKEAGYTVADVTGKQHKINIFIAGWPEKSKSSYIYGGWEFLAYIRRYIAGEERMKADNRVANLKWKAFINPQDKVVIVLVGNVPQTNSHNNVEIYVQVRSESVAEQMIAEMPESWKTEPLVLKFQKEAKTELV